MGDEKFENGTATYEPGSDKGKEEGKYENSTVPYQPGKEEEKHGGKEEDKYEGEVEEKYENGTAPYEPGSDEGKEEGKKENKGSVSLLWTASRRLSGAKRRVADASLESAITMTLNNSHGISTKMMSVTPTKTASASQTPRIASARDINQIKNV